MKNKIIVLLREDKSILKLSLDEVATNYLNSKSHFNYIIGKHHLIREAISSYVKEGIKASLNSTNDLIEIFHRVGEILLERSKIKTPKMIHCCECQSKYIEDYPQCPTCNEFNLTHPMNKDKIINSA
jgi:lipopolysaccharide biosynthesis regulator YciM